MFTGLVEERGTLGRLVPQGTGARLRVRCSLGGAEPLAMGESIAVDGVCLTVIAIHDDGFEADASAETLARTTLGKLREGSPVNLERAMKLGGRMGGHIVTGHVDDVGALAASTPDSGAVKMTFRMPKKLAFYVVEKGLIAVLGVSLTVNGVSADSFEVTVIPHTLSVTSLGSLAVGDAVNLEVDLVARYVARLHQADPGAREPGKSSDEEWLARLGRAGYV